MVGCWRLIRTFRPWPRGTRATGGRARRAGCRPSSLPGTTADERRWTRTRPWTVRREGAAGSGRKGYGGALRRGRVRRSTGRSCRRCAVRLRLRRWRPRPARSYFQKLGLAAVEVGLRVVVVVECARRAERRELTRRPASRTPTTRSSPPLAQHGCLHPELVRVASSCESSLDRQLRAGRLGCP